MIEKKSPKEKILKKARNCNKCGKCCNFGSGFVLKEETRRIASFLKIEEEDFKKEYLNKTIAYNKEVYKIKTTRLPYGRCRFLKKTLCSIHEVKPLMCRIASCRDKENTEWFLLNYIVDPYDRASVREWSIRLKTHKTIKGGDIEELIPDKNLRESLIKDYHED